MSQIQGDITANEYMALLMMTCATVLPLATSECRDEL